MASVSKHAGLLILAAIFGVAMGVVGHVDYRWTLILRDHRATGLLNFMGRSVFEGEAFGGGDIVVVYLLLPVAVYILGWKDRLSDRWLAWRPAAGFVIASTLVGSLGLVHALKWVMGRARPHLVLFTDLPFTQWYEWGPHFISDGMYRGSFPSGHASQAAVLMTLAYILAATPGHSRNQRIAGWLWGVVATGYAIVMGIARCMSLSHWVSDVIAGFFLPLTVQHLFFFRVIQVPRQARYARRNGRLPMTPAVWELRLSLYLLATLSGLALFFLGIRATLRDLSGLAGILIPIGIGVTLAFLFLAVRLHRNALSGLGKAPSGD
jgi:membrane-associated phospholipid phosphatase